MSSVWSETIGHKTGTAKVGKTETVEAKMAITADARGAKAVVSVGTTDAKKPETSGLKKAVISHLAGTDREYSKLKEDCKNAVAIASDAVKLVSEMKRFIEKTFILDHFSKICKRCDALEKRLDGAIATFLEFGKTAADAKTAAGEAVRVVAKMETSIEKTFLYDHFGAICGRCDLLETRLEGANADIAALTQMVKDLRQGQDALIRTGLKTPGSTPAAPGGSI